MGAKGGPSPSNRKIHKFLKSTGIAYDVAPLDAPYPGEMPDAYIQRGTAQTPLLAQMVQNKVPVLFMERGAWDRTKLNQLSWNGINGYGVRPNTDALLSRDHPTLSPWKEGPIREVLVCGQTAGDATLEGHDAYHIAGQLYKEACIAYPDALVRFRDHPNNEPQAVPLAKELVTTDLVVTYSSTSAVDAVLAGVPVHVSSQISLAYDMASPMGEIWRPCRAYWIHDLSYLHWTEDELESGDAADYILGAYRWAKAAAHRGEYYLGGDR